MLRSTLRCEQVLLCNTPRKMCTVDLITGQGPEPATVGVKVHLLWREKLEYPFTQGITFNSECTAISGRCIATRIEGGWCCIDSGDQRHCVCSQAAWQQPGTYAARQQSE